MKEFEDNIHKLEKKAMTGDKQAVIELAAAAMDGLTHSKPKNVCRP